MEPDGPFARMLYTIMAAVAGSVTALSFMKWKEMSGMEIALVLFTGAAFAIFLAPWAASKWFDVSFDDMQAVCGVVYLAGAGSNIFLPLIIRRVARTFGDEKGEEVIK